MEFELRPRPPFRLDVVAWTLRRRPHNIVDRWECETYRRVLPLPSGPVEVAVRQPSSRNSGRLSIRVTGQSLGAEVPSIVTQQLQRLLGLRIDLAQFHEVAANDPQLSQLAQRFVGMKPPRFPTLFECLVNAIACQQLSLTLGIHILNRLAVAFGAAFVGGEVTAYAFPQPEDLAGLEVEQLRPLGLSRQKSAAIIELARAIVAGECDLESLASLPDEEVVHRLCRFRGVGRWTAEYVLLRGMGRTHVFPGDDVGARNNLQQWLHLSQRLDYAGVQRELSGWRDYAGLIYFHLLLDRLAAAGHVADSVKVE